jgi:hypothetical protein
MLGFILSGLMILAVGALGIYYKWKDEQEERTKRDSAGQSPD